MQRPITTPRPRRSILYMPGSNARALEKARDIPVDAVVFDLEDAVAPDAKETARRQVAEAVGAGGYGAREVVIRINGLDTPWGRRDLAAAVAAEPHAILVPKVSEPLDLIPVQEAVGPGSSTAIWAMMETPRAMLNALSIAAAREGDVPGLSVMVMGTNDLAKDTRARLQPGRRVFLPWLMGCLAAARAYGLDVVDGVYNDFSDDEGFARECEEARDMGMDGKTLIHPRQVDACNRIFSPSPDEIAWARSVCDVFDRPENSGVGVLRIDGKMVERLHADVARRILAMAGGR